MKIAVVAPTSIPSRRANTFQVMKMAQAFAILGHQVRLIIPHSEVPGKTAPLSDLEELANDYGLQVDLFAAANPGGAGISLEWLASNHRLRRYDFAWRAVGISRKWQMDVFYTRLPQAAALASWQGIPTILEMHDLPRGTVHPRLLKAFLKGRGARRLVLITHILAKDLVEKFHVPAPSESPSTFTLVAPDGVDLERYANLPEPARARADLNMILKNKAGSVELAERFTVGYTGHLYPGRGVELILDLAQQLPEMNFLLVGGEPADVARLSHEIEVRRLGNLVITGFVSNRDLPRYQAACEVLVMPYQRRVAASSGGDIARYLSPMKAFEYMASGRAIISSNLPVLGEILNSKNAVLLPPDDQQLWVDALGNLSKSPELRARLAAQALQDVERYTWQCRAARILAGIPGLPTSVQGNGVRNGR